MMNNIIPMSKLFKPITILFAISFIFFNNLSAQFSSSENSQNSINAIAFNSISITIGGDFIVNGSFPSLNTERLDQFVTRIYNETKATLLTAVRSEEGMVEFKKNFEKYALRNIELKRKDGSELIIDLAMFRLTGNFEHNPYLKDGDVIVFPAYDDKVHFVSIDGAVNKPTEFQFVEGDNLQTAIFFAHGINTAYTDITKAEITRLKNNGETIETVEVPVYEEYPLQVGDRIRVLYSELNKQKYQVLVLGEVNRPGYIPISKNSTTLKEVIEKAGGFTPNASLKFSELVRNYDSFNTLRKEILARSVTEQNLMDLEETFRSNLIDLELLRMYRTANLQFRDTLYFKLDNQLRIFESSVSVDFAEINKPDSETSKFIVNDGDVIIVPQKSETVFVWGGVRESGYYNVDGQKSVWDYINDAGGYTDIAYGDDEVYLIKGKSRDWYLVEDHEEVPVEAGDYIYVKKERPIQEFWWYLGVIGSIAGILGGVATLVLLFK
ncbi:MAG: SLBB domain-containing protein [Melioribacteraceae bacterium]|nr:SLBB domain-containing protein [Melioribacteraceae bacterium]MDD3557051.1 SLBB domain-containing protein [Melioribacteraceae bacterium]